MFEIPLRYAVLDITVLFVCIAVLSVIGTALLIRPISIAPGRRPGFAGIWREGNSWSATTQKIVRWIFPVFGRPLAAPIKSRSNPASFA